MIAGSKIKSVTVLTDWAKTRSDSWKACEIGTSPLAINNLSFETMMIESTASFSSLSPATELAILVLPSKVKGRVTIAMVSAPSSRAICATIGEAPVPVPPPMPEAMKTMFAPRTMSRISSVD